MKRTALVFLMAILFAPTTYAQEALEIIWQKNIWQEYQVAHAVFSEDGQWIYAAAGNNIYKIDVNTGEKISEFENEGVFGGEISDIELSPDGSELITFNNPYLMIWDLGTESFLRKYEMPATKEDFYIEGFDFTKDGDLLISILRTEENQGKITAFRELLLVTYETNEIIKNKEYKTGTIKNEYIDMVAGNTSNLIALELLVTKNDVSQHNKIVLWDLETFEELTTLEQKPYVYEKKKIQFSDDDSYLGISKKWDLHVYDMQDYSLVLDRGTWAFDFLPDNIHVGCSDYSNTEGYSYQIIDILSGDTTNSIQIDFPIREIRTIKIDNNNFRIFTAYSKTNIALLNYDTSVSVVETGTTEAIHISQSEENIFIDANTQIINEVVITDINGVEVYGINDINNTSINIHNSFTSGIYFLLIKTNVQEYVEKINIVR